jgi:transcriptional regulator with GAF, ATPase, and Fis domain/CHASE2 domain-containing sensor protein
MQGSLIRRLLIVGAGVTLLALACSFLFANFIETVDHALLAKTFRLRGETRLDSSVVILYFSSDDLAILGDLPLKRSYYALLVNALHDLGAGAIGFDIGFTEQDKEHDEYDRVFAGVVKNAGNVVMSGYFRSLAADNAQAGSAMEEIPERLTVAASGLSASSMFPLGKQPELPFPALLDGVAGIGHTNFTDRFDIPAFVRNGDRLVPSFAVELLAVRNGVPTSGMAFAGHTVTLTGSGAPFVVPFDGDGNLAVNYAGGMQTLTVCPVIDFLKAYDIYKAGAAPPLPIKGLAGKIVLIGIIAEGRSAFVTTPFQSQFPSVALHAMAIENALHGDLLTHVPVFIETLLALLACLACTWLIAQRRAGTAVGVIIVLLVLCGGVSFGLFALKAVVLPLGRILFTTFFVSAVLLVYKHNEAESRVALMDEERSTLTNELAERERLLKALEYQVEEARKAGSADRDRLSTEAVRLREEMRTLKIQREEDNAQPAPAVIQGEERRSFHGILYHAHGPMAKVIEFVRMIANNDAPVMILGESGTGKELIANAIHAESDRKEKPFVAVNCGALTETLLESELFGHERGAFTGAVKEKPGRFERADTGTIFLDEIAETTEAFQVKLLRVLQEGTFERVGGTEMKHVNVRILAATNRDVKAQVKEKKFREDLYYRLNVFTVQLPSLRERAEDIPILSDAFVTAEAPGVQLSIAALDSLQRHQWKGNVRELQSAMKRACVLAKAAGRSIIYWKDLPSEIAEFTSGGDTMEERILATLRKKNFSRSAISETAEELGGLNRGTVAEYFRGICFKEFRAQNFDAAAAARELWSGAADDAKEKVEKKLAEYLSNAVEKVDRSSTLEISRQASQPKYKNLPQRYHPDLDALIEAYFKGEWKL